MSVSKQGEEITRRFFQAIDILKANGKIRSIRQVTNMYGLNYGNFYTMMKNPGLYILKPELIARLCSDFNISTEWVMLGYGDFFKKRTAIKGQKP